MFIPAGTVDHFRPVSADRSLAYEWSNYRYASAWLNSAKGQAEVLDPFQVQDDWFEVILPSLQLVLTDKIPTELRPLARATIDRLGLRDDERTIRVRREWLAFYEAGDMSLSVLRRMAPLVARAVDRQQGGATV